MGHEPGGVDATRHQNLSEGTSAQAYATVDAACHLACSIEAGDRLTVGVEHTALFIHHQSTHGVMGGTTVYFNAADFDDVCEAANAEKEGTEGEGAE